MKEQCKPYAGKSRKKLKSLKVNMKIILFCCMILSVVFAGGSTLADSALLSLSTDTVYAGEETVLTVMRTTGMDETVTVTLPVNITVEEEKTEAGLAGTLEYSYDAGMNEVQIVFPWNSVVNKAKIYITPEEAQEYQITAQSSNEMSGELTLTAQENVTEEEPASEEATTEEITTEEVTTDQVTTEEVTTEEVTTEEVTAEEVTTEQVTEQTTTGQTAIKGFAASQAIISPFADTVTSVSNWSEFCAAVANTTVTHISLTNDITKDATYASATMGGTVARSLVILGNGKTIDFGSTQTSAIILSGTAGGTLALSDVNIVKTYVANAANPAIYSSGTGSWNITLSKVSSGTGTAGLVYSANATVIVDGANSWTTNGAVYLFYVKNFEMAEGASLEATSNGAANSTICINTGTVTLNKGSNLRITNSGSGNATNTNATDPYGIFGSISSFSMDSGAKANIKATNSAYYTNVTNSFTMSDGAQFTATSSAYGNTHGTIHLGTGGSSTPATVLIQGENTLLDVSSTYSGTSSAFFAYGNSCSVTVTDKAVLNAYGSSDDGLYIYGTNTIFKVSAEATVNITSGGSSRGSYYGGGLHINGASTALTVDNATLKVERLKTSVSGAACGPAIYITGTGTQFTVNNAGRLYVHNGGNGTPNNTDTNCGIRLEYTSTFTLADENSSVEILSDYGNAMWTNGCTINAGEGTIYIMQANGNSSANGTVIYAIQNLNFTMYKLKYFDFRNNRTTSTATNGGLFSCYGGSTFVITQSDLSVWSAKSNLEGTPSYSWTRSDYSLRNTNFQTVDTTGSSPAFSSNAAVKSGGMTSFSRMSANNATATIDSLWVPTNADKYIYGHVTVAEGLTTRDAWTDEVFVTVEVYDENNSLVCTLEGATVGADDTNDGLGLDMYGEGGLPGMYKILYAPPDHPDGTLLPVGYTVKVVSAYRSALGKIDNNTVFEGNVRRSTEDDITKTIVEVIDVTPPSPVVLSTASDEITTKTTVISGTSDEVGATIRVKVNGAWLTDPDSGAILTATVSSDGTWIFTLPAKLATDAVVGIYASDNIGEIEIPEDEHTLPITSNTLGNINPDRDTVYHDTTFLARVARIVIYNGDLSFASFPTEIDFGQLKISSLNESYGAPVCDIPLVVTDDRLTKANWRVTATLTDPLYNETQDSTLEGENGGLVYYTGGVEKVLSDESTEIYRYTTAGTADVEVNVSNTWTVSSGLLLKVSAGAARVGTYKGTIEWVLGDVP